MSRGLRGHLAVPWARLTGPHSPAQSRAPPQDRSSSSCGSSMVSGERSPRDLAPPAAGHLCKSSQPGTPYMGAVGHAPAAPTRAPRPTPQPCNLTTGQAQRCPNRISGAALSGLGRLGKIVAIIARFRAGGWHLPPGSCRHLPHLLQAVIPGGCPGRWYRGTVPGVSLGTASPSPGAQSASTAPGVGSIPQPQDPQKAPACWAPPPCSAEKPRQADCPSDGVPGARPSRWAAGCGAQTVQWPGGGYHVLGHRGPSWRPLPSQSPGTSVLGSSGHAASQGLPGPLSAPQP